MKQYEALIILKPELEGDGLQIALKEILDILKKYQCDIENTNEWGKRPLAYNMAKKKEGFYYIVNFKGNPKDISKIKRDFTLNENVLRAMITHRDKKINQEAKCQQA